MPPTQATVSGMRVFTPLVWGLGELLSVTFWAPRPDSLSTPGWLLCVRDIVNLRRNESPGAILAAASSVPVVNGKIREDCRSSKRPPGLKSQLSLLVVLATDSEEDRPFPGLLLLNFCLRQKPARGSPREETMRCLWGLRTRWQRT